MGAVEQVSGIGSDLVEGASLVPTISDRSVGSQLRSLLDPVRWDDRHRSLAAQPLFGACTRAEIRRVVAWGEDITIEGGEVVARQGAIGHWFFVVLDGELTLRRRGRSSTVVGAGGFVGGETILGFAPQPTTVTTVGRTRLFVLGRRHLLSLVHIPAIQRCLLPGTAPADVTERLRTMRHEGELAWRRLQQSERYQRQPVVVSDAFRRVRSSRTSRASSGLAFSGLAAVALVPGRSGAAEPDVSRRLAARARLAIACLLVLLVLVVSVAYHPPVVVVTPLAAIDVVDDIVIKGVEVHRPSGRYLMTGVRYEQPNVVGLVTARLAGRPTAWLRSGDTPGHEQASRDRALRRFAASRARAAELATGLAGVVLGEGTTVRFRERSFTGGSAALVYALALADLLSPEDLSRGRTIAATGELSPDGRVSGVGFAGVKANAARAARADLFLVSHNDVATVSGGQLEVMGVGSLDDALAALRTASAVGASGADPVSTDERRG